MITFISKDEVGFALHYVPDLPDKPRSAQLKLKLYANLNLIDQTLNKNRYKKHKVPVISRKSYKIEDAKSKTLMCLLRIPPHPASSQAAFTSGIKIIIKVIQQHFRTLNDYQRDLAHALLTNNKALIFYRSQQKQDKNA